MAHNSSGHAVRRSGKGTWVYSTANEGNTESNRRHSNEKRTQERVDVIHYSVDTTCDPPVSWIPFGGEEGGGHKSHLSQSTPGIQENTQSQATFPPPTTTTHTTQPTSQRDVAYHASDACPACGTKCVFVSERGPVLAKRDSYIKRPCPFLVCTQHTTITHGNAPRRPQFPNPLFATNQTARTQAIGLARSHWLCPLPPAVHE